MESCRSDATFFTMIFFKCNGQLYKAEKLRYNWFLKSIFSLCVVAHWYGVSTGYIPLLNMFGLRIVYILIKAF